MFRIRRENTIKYLSAAMTTLQAEKCMLHTPPAKTLRIRAALNKEE
jgi:hypothetical protein